MSFEVVPSTLPQPFQDWWRAKNLPADELPELTLEEHAKAKRMRISDESYSRFYVYLANRVRERQRVEGQAFGELVEKMLREAGSAFHVSSVRRTATGGWGVYVVDSEGKADSFKSEPAVVHALLDRTATQEQLDDYREQLMELGGYAGTEVHA